MTQTIQQFKAVRFTYTISDLEGNVIEQIDEPVNYIHGCGDLGLIECVEKALEGHQAGDTVEVDVPAAEGFGEFDPKLIFVYKLADVPPEYRKVGAQIEFKNDRGESKLFLVSKIEDEKVTLDGNHPLAGNDAKFSVTIHEVRDATQEEINQSMGNPETKH